MNLKLVVRAAYTLSVLATVAAAPCAQAAQNSPEHNYPAKPIRLLVGFPVGGGADVAARVLGPRMSESLGQQIIVDNRPGAGSAIASEITAKAPPDGYTLVSIGSSHAVNAALYPKLPYAPAAGFSAIAIVATSPVVITANPAVPAKTLKELIALARSRPGQLNYGAAGVNGINHLAAELLKRTANFDITLVPYKGVAQALPAVVAGEVQLMFATLPGSIDQIRTGRIRAIAVTSAKRANAAPDIPTVAESGVPGYEASSWFALLAPAGTPRTIVTRLNAEALKALQMREVQESLTRQGMDPTGSTPAEADAYLKSEIAKWTRVVREAGIRTEQ
ncbi:MAG TPA: tripartite tricarboxylate transporter substrate binding protein [Burkholderiales bacterium]|nr:tripartite tricarboxylate transporter substrate binding protein [Burkholderiales bacterium]